MKYKGIVLVNVLIYATIGVLMMSAIIGYTATVYRASKQFVIKEKTFHLAESGNEVFRWRLAHSAQTDYTAGFATTSTSTVFFDKDGNRLGTLRFTITQPATGSTRVILRSEGRLDASSTTKRTIQTTLAIPSMARFAVAANDVMRFGEGTEVFGAVHSNQGIRFDGIANNVVTSAVATYDDPDHSGGAEFGVHTHVTSVSGTVTDSYRADEAPPTNPVPTKSHVFRAGRQFPVPAIDFAGFIVDFASLKTKAQSAQGRYHAASGQSGYRITLRTNGTYDLHRVNSQQNTSGSCGATSNSVNGTTFIGNYAYPVNGVIYVEDNLWVQGQINNNRLIIVAATLPDSAPTRRNIYITNDILYTFYDGRDALGLMTQNNISVGLNSEDDLRIDGALITQYGRVGRDYYNNNCGTNRNRSVLTSYGAIGSALRYGFAWTDGSGYDTRNLIYDANLLYAPPPFFPLTGDKYQTIGWEEVE